MGQRRSVLWQQDVVRFDGCATQAGIGGNFRIDGSNSLRFDDTRLHFDNGSNANLFGLRDVYGVGRR